MTILRQGSPAHPKLSLLAVAKLLAVPIIVGLVIRAILAPLTSWIHDDSAWWWATIGGVQHIELYKRLGFPYPPIWGYLLQGMGWVAHELGATSSSFGVQNLSLEKIDVADQASLIVTTPLFNFLFKGLLSLFDLATGLLLFQLTYRLTENQRRARLAFLLWFLNPFVIFETSVFGAFDVIIGFCVLASIVQLLDRRYAWSGLLLAVAIFTKLSPVMLLPLFVLLLLKGGLEPGDARRASLTRFALGGIGASVVILLPIIITNQFYQGADNILGLANGTSVGGLSIFSALDWRGAEQIAKEVYQFSWLGSAVLAAQVVASLLLAAAGLRLSRRDPSFSVIATAGLILAVVVFLGPAANPQYLLWFLPEVVILVAVWHRGSTSLSLFSVCGIVYLCDLYSPVYLLFPLAQFTPIVSSQSLMAISRRWANLRAAPWSFGSAGSSLFGPLSILVLIALFVLMRQVLWRPVPRRQRSWLSGPGACLRWLVPVTTCIVLVGAVAGELAVAASPSPAQVLISVSPQQSASSSTLDVSAAVRPGSSLGSLSLVNLPLSSTSVVKTVDVYRDTGYPVLDTSQQIMTGVWDQVSGQLALLGYSGVVQQQNATQLQQVLTDTKNAPSTAIIYMSGILPAPTFSSTTNLLTPWLEAGGTLYWGGPPIGSNIATGNDQGGPPGPIENLGTAGTAEILDPQLIGRGGDGMGTNATSLASSLNLVYRPIGWGVQVSPPVQGVTPLGWTSTGRSSITSIVIGTGHLVLFGGVITNEHLVAPDMTRLIMTGGSNLTGTVASTPVSTSIVQNGGVVRWSVPVSPAPNEGAVVAIDPALAGTMFKRAPWSLGA